MVRKKESEFEKALKKYEKENHDEQPSKFDKAINILLYLIVGLFVFIVIISEIEQFILVVLFSAIILRLIVFLRKKENHPSFFAIIPFVISLFFVGLFGAFIFTLGYWLLRKLKSKMQGD